MGPRHWFQGMNSTSLCSLAGRYENPIPPRCPAPIDFLKIPAQVSRTMNKPESVATLPPFSPIEGQKWFDQISSQWESQKNRFTLIYFGKIQFLPPCIWNLPFMSTASELRFQWVRRVSVSLRGIVDFWARVEVRTKYKYLDLEIGLHIYYFCNFLHKDDVFFPNSRSFVTHNLIREDIKFPHIIQEQSNPLTKYLILINKQLSWAKLFFLLLSFSSVLG